MLNDFFLDITAFEPHSIIGGILIIHVRSNELI